jgi:hypothetical protein
MIVFGGQGPAGPLDDLWFLDWTDTTQVSALGAGLAKDGVHLLWQEISGGTSTPELHRQQDGGSWITLGNLSPQPDGRILYTDTAISPGVQYNYGISLDSLDVQSLVGVITVRVPSSPSTPALLSLMDARADSGIVALQWYSGDPSASSWELERRTEVDAWSSIGPLSPDGDHILRYEDTRVIPGTRYGYRVGYQSGGRLLDSPEVWISVPLQVSFGIRGARPNPAVGPLTVSFSLLRIAPARLELLDVSGRIRISRELGTLGPGDYDLPLMESAALPAGLYFVRLTQGAQAATSKVCFVR